MVSLGKMDARQNDELSPIQDDHDETPSENAGSRVQERASVNRRRYFAVLCILFVELCERLTFYGVTANLVFYCKDVLELSSPLPSTITLAFQGKVSAWNFTMRSLIKGRV